MPGIDVQLGNGWTMVHLYLVVARTVKMLSWQKMG